MSGQSENLVPYTPMMQLVKATKAVKQTGSSAALHALATGLLANPELLCRAFEASVVQFEARFDEEPLPFRKAPKLPPAPPVAGVLSRDRDLDWYFHRQGALSIDGMPHLDVSYVDYEVSIIRKLHDVRFDTPGRPKAGKAFRLDALAVNANDCAVVPIEIKLKEDADPFSALIQLLNYVALLATGSQRRRVRKHYESAASGDADARLDAYIALHEFGSNENSAHFPLKRDLDSIASELAKTIMTGCPAISGHVRRIVCLDVRLDEAGDEWRLGAGPRWVHESG